MRKKHTARTYTASFKAEALQYLANGASITQTANNFKVRLDTLWIWCFQAVMPTNRKIQDYQKDICQEYLDSDLTQDEIAIKYKIKKHTLQRWLYMYRKTDTNIISATNSDGSKNYAQLEETPPEVKLTSTAAVYHNIDDKGAVAGCPTTRRWIEGVS
jgi:transposase-like protein